VPKRELTPGEKKEYDKLMEEGRALMTAAGSEGISKEEKARLQHAARMLFAKAYSMIRILPAHAEEDRVNDLTAALTKLGL
jgi:hypothetical protein